MAKKTTKAPATKLTIIDCEQGSDEWRAARAGIPTASNFATVMANGRDGGDLKTRTSLLYALAAEIITGEPIEDTFKSLAMQRGNAMEADARADYESRTGVEVQRVGFARNFSGLRLCGASPDGLVGFDGLLEIKTMRPDLIIPLLFNGSGMPPAHRAQVQGNIWVLEREWCDFKIYWPNMPNFTVRVHRDDVYIRQLSDEIERFNYDVNHIVEKLRKMGAT